MSLTPRQLSAITLGEALTLLAGVPLGRIVFTDHALPAVRPASHVVDEGQIVVRTHDGSPVLAHDTSAVPARGRDEDTVIAYQADSVDVGDRTGWSVVITGTATLVTDPARIARYADTLPPWTAAEGGLIRLRPGIVAGYRLVS
jgi:hypothetical protein